MAKKIEQRRKVEVKLTNQIIKVVKLKKKLIRKKSPVMLKCKIYQEKNGKSE